MKDFVKLLTRGALIRAVVPVAFIISVFAGCSASASGPSAAPNSTPVSSASTVSTEATIPDSAGAPTEQPAVVEPQAADKVLLVVSFGTSYNDNRAASIGAVENALAATYSDYQVRRAFTSQIIIDKLYDRDGILIDNVTQAMERLVLDKVKEVIVQPTTIMDGYEYDDVIEEVTAYAGKFESLKIGSQLLNTAADITELADALVTELDEYKTDGTAVVMMGHGTEHEANAVYAKFQDELDSRTGNNIVIGTVEGSPTFDDVKGELSERGAKRVILLPLMIVAGDHANNDMAGTEPDSWASLLTAEGYEVETVIKGLGEMPSVHGMIAKHVKAAIASERVVASTPAPEPISNGAALDAGSYSVTVDSSSSMFNIIAAVLNVSADGTMSADLTLSGDGYSMLFMGTAEEAAAADASQFSEFTVDANGKYVYSVTVDALDSELDCAAFSVKNQIWYDRTITLNSASATLLEPTSVPGQISVDPIADGEYSASVTLTGGTGKATVNSPASVVVANGVETATIQWSSSNYEYMIIGGEKYLPVTTEGGSVFEIPITFNEDMAVTACTIAMGSPRVIEYTLRFELS